MADDKTHVGDANAEAARPKSPSEARTVIETSAKAEPSKGSPNQYVVKRNEMSALNRVTVPEPAPAPPSDASKATERTVVIPEQANTPPGAQHPGRRNTLPRIAVAPSTPPATKPAAQTLVIPGVGGAPATSTAAGTPQPIGAGTGTTPRARRSSEGPSVQGQSNKWDAYSSVGGPPQPEPGSVSEVGDSTGVHAVAGRPHPGVRINQYEMIKMIGEGGMGTVYLARDLRLGRRVAIKFLQSNQAELTQRFLVEARATARCQHDNIVIVYEVGEHNGSPYMVLEFLTGKPLTESIKDGTRLPYSRSVEVMMSVVRALECAHGQGIVHRDLKPDNIFITDSGTIKVLDFGIAKVLEAQTTQAPQMSGQIKMPSPLELATGSNTALTRHGTIMGTLKYMSPEQWGIGIEIDHLSDIWASGVLLHRLICGRHPLHPLDGNQLVVTAMLELPMPSMAEAAPPDCPRELIQIVDRCLLKAKEQRWQSASELLRALEPFLPGRRAVELTVDESPYAGLSSFQESDAGKFFGRTKEIAAMVTRIRDRPLMAVVGSSGVGKSSFVRAGLVPALKRSGEVWETLVIRPGRSPMEALGGIVAPMVGTAVNLADELDEQQKLVHKLRTEPGHLGHMLRGRARRDNRKILLFVDQFEELYTQVADATERAAFTAAIAAIADDATSPLRVVLSIRSDFLDRVAEDQAFLTELTQGLFFLGPPNREGLRDAITQPAELAGFRFELPATVEDMLDHLATTPGALPLLQFAASKLWESRDSARRMLTHQSYTQMGGVAGALASHADRVVQEIGSHKQGLARAILLRLVSPERTRAIVPMDELRELSREMGEVQRLVDHMVDARLLVVQTLEGGKGSTVEIVHESLIHNWPTLRRWLDETQEDAALIDQLRVAARQWHTKGRSADLLWRGDTAEEATKFKKRYKGPLSDVERAFLDEVISYEVALQRRKRTAVIGGFVGLGIIVLAAMIALVVIQRRGEEARHQTSLARKSEQDAKEALGAVQQKERERQQAEAAKQVVTVKLDSAEEDLKKKNTELEAALAESKQNEGLAKQNEELAKSNAAIAVQNAEKAEKAQADAVAQKDQVLVQKQLVESLLKQEQERVKRLQAQIGSPIVDELK
jgi:serine/threonine protein kinase